MKILLAHMWMVIGGAETHVVELARELASRGHDVTVASFGGVYLEQLERAGIKHIKVPLHSRDPFSVTRSYFILKRLIKKEKYDIVHAHSRIPAFVCGMLARRMGFRFVTTAHSIFKVSSMLRRASDWGDHTFAVSCDIKQYLIDSYGVPSDNVTLTVNGIDMNRFSPDVDASGVIDELGLGADAFRAVCVSRTDRETVKPCLELCVAAGIIAERIPNFEVVIVGDGDSFDELRACADSVNASLERKCIRLTGARTDIPEMVSAADIFVGVSRAALEAMSASKPTIFAGPLGYGGIFRDEIKSVARLTNYTFRGERASRAEEIASDILKLYSMSHDERAYYGALGYEEVKERYSMAKMADSHLSLYERLTPYHRYRHGDIIISGYYGYDNIGDDSLLTPITDGIRERIPGAKITVLSRKPKEVARICRAKTVNRFNAIKVLSEMRHAKLLISGGGSLLQDGTSKKSLFYYTYVMRMAKRYGLKVMIYANGLGPLSAESSRNASAQVISAADYVSLRETDSLTLARELGVTREMHVSADPAFLLEGASELWIDYIKVRENIDKDYFIVSVKDGNTFDGAKTGRDVLSTMAEDIRKIYEKYSLIPLFVPMYPSRDTAITKRLMAKVGVGRLLLGLTASELCGLMSRARFVIGTRLHTLIFAASVAVPMIGISYDPKIDAFLDYIGQRERLLDIRTLGEGELWEAADALILAEKDVRSHLEALAIELRGKALTDCDAVQMVLNQK